MRHEASQAASSVSAPNLQIHTKSSHQTVSSASMSSSFLNDESATDTADSEDDKAKPDSESPRPIGRVRTPSTSSNDKGWTFDSLVDRLVSLPTSKTDSKFAAIFLALYRRFAAPGQLLEAIILRFEDLDNQDSVMMSRTITQLRYLTIIEQWIRCYPGDFAHGRTFRMVKSFIVRIESTRIFSAAAHEMSSDLEHVAEDDDTEWDCCDKDRSAKGGLEIATVWSHKGGATTAFGVPTFDFPDELGDLSLNDRRGNERNDSKTSTSSKECNLRVVESSQREAEKLTPTPTFTISKIQWRALMTIPEIVIAREMTRIDWILFSSIRPRDLVRHVSLTPAQKAKCKSLANVARLIEHFNHVRDWVANYILFRDKPKHRALMLEKFMIVARKLREMNNYNSLGAVLAGINSTAVHRLSATRELIPPESHKDWMKMEILMSQTRSFTAYRLAWENSSTERIPYLPLCIRDLMAARTGNKTFVGDEAHGRINWRKFEVMGDVLVSIERAQGLPYKMSAFRKEEVQSLLLCSRLTRDDDVSQKETFIIDAH